jgi:hypothetical protein
MPAFQAEEINRSPEVRRWLAGAGYDNRPADRAVVLDSLRGFCDFTGQRPAELVAACLRSTSEGTAISTKGRREMQARIDSYVQARGLRGRDAIVVGNHVRGFLVHNGVFIQGPVFAS